MMADVSKKKKKPRLLQANPCSLECQPIYVFKGRLRIRFINDSHAYPCKILGELLVKFALMGIGATTVFTMFTFDLLRDCFPHMDHNSAKVRHGSICTVAMQFFIPFSYLLINQFNGTSRGWKRYHLMRTFAIFKVVGTIALLFEATVVHYRNSSVLGSGLAPSQRNELALNGSRCGSKTLQGETLPICRVAGPPRNGSTHVPRPVWAKLAPFTHYGFGFLALILSFFDLLALSLLIFLTHHEEVRNFAIKSMLLLNIPYIVCSGICLISLAYLVCDSPWNHKFASFAHFFNIFLLLFLLFDALLRHFVPDFFMKRDCSVIKPKKEDLQEVKKKMKKIRRECNRLYPGQKKKKKPKVKTSDEPPAEMTPLEIIQAEEEKLKCLKGISKQEPALALLHKTTKKIEKLRMQHERAMEKAKQKLEKLEAKSLRKAEMDAEKAKAKQMKARAKADQQIEKAKMKALKEEEKTNKQCEKERLKVSKKAQQDIDKAEKGYLKIIEKTTT